MDTYNTTWISTITGTGTTWTFSVVKEILNLTKKNILPEKVYKHKEDYFKIFKENALRDNDSRNHYVMQCHAILAIPLLKARCKVITNIRNPYDACASHYEFMKCSIGDAICNAVHIPMLIQHYSSLGPEKVFVLAFEDIDERPKDLISRISKFLGVAIDKNAISVIANKYSRKNVSKMIAKNDRVLSDKIFTGQAISEDEIVKNPANKKGIGSFDLQTGYQSRQVSKRKNGEWRTAFSPAQILEVIEGLDDIAISLGYKSEKG